jgi:hypothetical protein
VAQIFSDSTDKLLKTMGLIVPFLLAAVVGAIWYWWSPQYTDAGYRPKQPVAFSHELHAGELGLDCRYCHSTVEVAAYAAIPATGTCMNCHKFVAPESAKLELVRKAHAGGEPLAWKRVHMLPDYAYFDHSVHLAAGVGCASCHGRIDQMDVVHQDQSLSMGWCLDCHRNPTPHLRPLGEVTNMAYDPQIAGYDHTVDPDRNRQLQPPLYCSGCHQ